MPDRIIRDELLQSTRWLDLPTDTHRLIFVGLILIADDFGNIEGGPRRLFRWMQGFSQVKIDADAIKLMSDLQDSDLVRRYEVGSREFWHLPRHACNRQYMTRRVPESPWCPQNAILGKDKRIYNRGLAKNLPQTLTERSEYVLQGVGVGVGIGIGNSKALAQKFAQFWSAYPKKKSKGAAEKTFKRINPKKTLFLIWARASQLHSTKLLLQSMRLWAQIWSRNILKILKYYSADPHLLL